jgi:hypothetical protein
MLLKRHPFIHQVHTCAAYSAAACCVHYIYAAYACCVQSTPLLHAACNTFAWSALINILICCMLFICTRVMDVVRDLSCCCVLCATYLLLHAVCNISQLVHAAECSAVAVVCATHPAGCDVISCCHNLAISPSTHMHGGAHRRLRGVPHPTLYLLARSSLIPWLQSAVVPCISPEETDAYPGAALTTTSPPQAPRTSGLAATSTAACGRTHSPAEAGWDKGIRGRMCTACTTAYILYAVMVSIMDTITRSLARSQ